MPRKSRPRSERDDGPPTDYKARRRISFKRKTGEIVSFPKGMHVTVSTFKGKLILSTIRGMFVISPKTLEECFRPFSKYYKNDGGKVYDKARQRGTHTRSKAYNTIKAATANLKRKGFNDPK